MHTVQLLGASLLLWIFIFVVLLSADGKGMDDVFPPMKKTNGEPDPEMNRVIGMAWATTIIVTGLFLIFLPL